MLRRAIIQFRFMQQAVINQQKDQYNGVHLKLEKEVKQHQLQEQIESLLGVNNSLTSIWVHLNGNNLQHIQTLVKKYNFKIHHGLAQNIVAYKWLLQIQDKVTPYSMFYISCGAILIHQGRILLVQQKNGGRKGHFGLPGGRADLGQTLAQCAQRELFEETGIAAKYSYIPYYRELTNTLFGGCDIYFACVMTFKEKDLQVKLCERELSSYRWVQLNDYYDFIKENAKGTQLYVAKYLTDLHRQGYDLTVPFNNSLQNQYIGFIDNIKRIQVQHKLYLPNK